MQNNLTLSEKIYHELYDDIIHQRLECGQKLTLNKMKERFSVSHTPIREALTRLAENGLVNYYSNCGVKVVDFSEAEIREIYQFMGELDALAIKFCDTSAARIPLQYEIHEIIEKESNAVSENDMDAWKECSEEIHLVFYNYANNRYLNEAAKKVRARLELLSAIYYDNENIHDIHKSHYSIYEDIAAGKFDDAANKMRMHLQRSMMYAIKSYTEYKNKKINDEKK